MHQAIEERRPEIVEACRRFAVRRLEVFGSAARGDDFDHRRSDVDFLVTFEVDPGLSLLRRYLGLAEALESLLGRPVDLLDRETIERSRNHFRKRAILAGAQPIYG